MENKEKQESKGGMKHYFDFGDVLTYFFRKKDPNNKPNFSLRMMHGINKFAILVFLMAFIIWLIKRLT